MSRICEMCNHSMISEFWCSECGYVFPDSCACGKFEPKAPKMTFEELKAEAKRQGYTLQKSQKGICTCFVGREEQLRSGRKKCLNYEWERNTKNYCYCRKKAVEE